MFLELSDDISLTIQNARDTSSLDPDTDVTPERFQTIRALHEFNLMAVRLGLVRPQLNEDQISKLPPKILARLTDAITMTDRQKPETEILTTVAENTEPETTN